MTRPDTPNVHEIATGAGSADAYMQSNLRRIRCHLRKPIPLYRAATFGALPTASSYENCMAIVSAGTVGVLGTLYVSDGSVWREVSSSKAVHDRILLRMNEGHIPPGQTLTYRTWEEVWMNEEEFDEGDNCSLDTTTNPGRFTLDEGTYIVNAMVPTQYVARVQLYNVTDASVAIEGQQLEMDLAGVTNFVSDKALWVKGQLDVPSGGRTYVLRAYTDAVSGAFDGSVHIYVPLPDNVDSFSVFCELRKIS